MTNKREYSMKVFMAFRNIFRKYACIPNVKANGNRNKST